MAFGLDYSDARPSHAAMRTAGVRFVCRYIGSQVRKAGRDAKWLSPSEAKSLHADGFDVGVVFETTAQRADGGRAAGLADAHTAVAELAYCGLPAGMPVYFAVDYDATVGPQISAYFKAIGEVLGLKRVGAYAGYKVIKVLLDKHLITYAWQTYAWSGGQWDHRNHIEQYSNNRRVGGESVDYDRSMKADFGQWRAGASPTPTPTPTEETDMAQRDLRDGLDKRTGLILIPKTGGYTTFEAFADNTLDDGKQVKPFAPVSLRVVIEKSDGSWQRVEPFVVGRAAKDTKQPRFRIKLDDKNSVAVGVTRIDGVGTEEITVTAY